jgi:hypothetical protein
MQESATPAKMRQAGLQLILHTSDSNLWDLTLRGLWLTVRLRTEDRYT